MAVGLMVRHGLAGLGVSAPFAPPGRFHNGDRAWFRQCRRRKIKFAKTIVVGATIALVVVVIVLPAFEVTQYGPTLNP
jgi:hypothetical protein